MLAKLRLLSGLSNLCIYFSLGASVLILSLYGNWFPPKGVFTDNASHNN